MRPGLRLARLQCLVAFLSPSFRTTNTEHAAGMFSANAYCHISLFEDDLFRLRDRYRHSGALAVVPANVPSTVLGNVQTPAIRSSIRNRNASFYCEHPTVRCRALVLFLAY